MQKIPIAKLTDDSVIIEDQKSANRFYNRGYYGTPESGGTLRLELIEAYYLLDEKKIRIVNKNRDFDLEDLLTHITKLEPTFEIKYIVYRDLRTRGNIVKPSNITDFVIYGETSGASKSLSKRKIKYWSLAVSERAQFRVSEFCEILQTADNTRKDLIAAVVDEEGDITYYKVSSATPKGKVKRRKWKKIISESAVLVEDRVMLWDPILISELRNIGFYGNFIGSSLQLSLIESAFLLEQNILMIKLAKTRRKLTLKQFLKIARKLQLDFDRRLTVYRELKSRNLIVKTGFKYGAHFRVYEGDPNYDHSESLVHSVPANFEASWEEISRAVRLAQGVRKAMLFGRVLDENEGIEYINVERIKP